MLLQPFWGAMVRELFLCVGIAALMSGVRDMRSMLKSSYELVEQLLGTACDGYVLLYHDGSVAYADPTATDVLGLGPEAAATCSAPARPFGSGQEVTQGLRTLRLATPAGKRLEVETFTVPCPVTPQGVPLLLARRLQAPVPLQAEGQRYLCTIHIRQELNELGEVGPEAEAGGRRAGGKPSGVLITPDFSSGSGDLPPLSELASVVEPRPSASERHAQPYTLPGSPWQAIQAVGLGVGAYKKVRIIGRGGQGSVWQVTSPDGVHYAQKEISLKGVLWHVDFPKRLRDADREVRALKGLAWASCVIVPIIDCWITSDFEQACIVMEWLPRNLNDVLRQRRQEQSGPVRLRDVCNWLAQIAVGIAAVHSAGFIHRDLKTANILLDEQLSQCKIADLGVSRPLHRQSKAQEQASASFWEPSDFAEEASVVSTKSEKTKLSMATSVEPQSILSGYTVRPGTNAYTSPEALRSTDYGCLSDIFSLGCVLLEVLTLEMPPELPFGETESAVPARARELLTPTSAKPRAELQSLCLAMLSPAPEDRPCAAEVANRAFLRPQVEALVLQCSRLQSVLTLGAS